MIKKMLVALDGSEPANRALDFALDLANKYSSEVLLFTVIQPITIPYFIYEEMPTPIEADSYSRRLEAYYKNILSEALKKVKKEQEEKKSSNQAEVGQRRTGW